MNINPLMAEYAGISPGLKAALSQAGQAPPTNASQITPQMKSDAAPMDAGPAPEFAPIKMPGADAVPTLGAPPSPNVQPPIAGTLAGDSQNRQTLMQHGPGVEHIASRIEGALPNHPILGKILGGVTQGAATLGDTLFHAALPGAERMTPGTEGNFAHNLSRANAAVTQDETNVKDEAQTTNLGATTAHENAETAGLPQQQADTHARSEAEVGNLNSETTARDNPKPQFENTPQGPMMIHPDGTAQHVTVDGKPIGAPVKLTYQTVDGKDGPHVYGVDEKGNKVVDLGKHYERPISVNTGANHEFQEQERGRGLLDKAEAAYRTAQQGANTMRDMVASARGGNKMSAQVLPLEGALAITTAQGVHRINRTEVDQYAGAGNLYDRIAGEVGKLTAGQPIPQNILNDIEQLTAIQERGAYGTYKGAYDSATHRYKLNDEKPLDAPGGGVAPTGADNEVYVGGKLVGHTVGGKYVALGSK